MCVLDGVAGDGAAGSSGMMDDVQRRKSVGSGIHLTGSSPRGIKFAHCGRGVSAEHDERVCMGVEVSGSSRKICKTMHVHLGFPNCWTAEWRIEETRYGSVRGAAFCHPSACQ